ncbi:MAG: hypothetical protein WBV55_07385 [Candidatus Sulfotelmatobacter sp.]
MQCLSNGKAADRSEMMGKLTTTNWKFVAFVCPRFSESRAITFLAILLFAMLFAQLPLLGQTSITTWHYDNGRSGADTTETLLTPSNVNSKSFGKLFTLPVDGYIVGHPLYLPGVSISGQGTHNVVYVATMHDSVYAFDADSGNTSPLWMTSLLSYSPAGATTVPATVKKNAGTTGWTELGIISTPVIDAATNTLYAVAETYESGKVVHRLHVLDVTSGLEKFGGPKTIAATYTLNGVTTPFTDFYQMNRPGLLMANGHIYIAFGSNGNNTDPCQGWVLSYNAGTLQLEGAYTVEPGKNLASIWQKGAGLSADTQGNIYGESGEGPYVDGSNFSSSVQKLTQTGTNLALADWFTPYNQDYLSENDLDLNDGILILPNQPGPYPHELITGGKEGTIYVLNRDNMGQYCSTCTTGDTQIVQELPQAAPYSGIPVYWNNTVYFTADRKPVYSYSLENGKLVTPPLAQSSSDPGGGHAVITANGTSDGILWFVNGNTLVAMNAVTLKALYYSSQAPGGRDTVPPLPHFASPVAADGKVFIGTQSSVVVFGLFPTLSPTGGSGQSATAASTLPVPLTVQALNLYTQNTFPGVTVAFSDSGKGGTFNPPTTVTDSNGSASTSYTLPAKVGSYTLTASATGYPAGLFTETALPATAKTLAAWNGNNQSAPVTTPLPNPLVVKVKDSFGNGVAGVQVSYTDSGSGGSFSPNPATTNSTGLASVTYTTSKTAGALHGKILASVPGLASLIFFETVTPGPAATITATSGSGQSTPPITQLPQPLVAKVTDQYGNAVSGVAVTFNDGGAGGTFSTNPVSTSSTGVASITYTTSPNAGTVNIQAVAAGVSTPAAFTETVQ